MNSLKFISAAFLFQIIMILPLPALSLSGEIQKTFENLSQKYTEVYPNILVKKGLAVLPFKEDSESAKKAGIGNTVRELISREAARSTIFYLVDRDTLKESLKEQKLALSGLIDEKTTIEPGNTAGVAVFITGSVSEIKDEYQISVKMTDVETSKVIDIETALIPKKELVQAGNQIAFEYIAQYGLGINFQESFALSIESPREDYTFRLTDVYVNYRPKLWLSLKLGVCSLNLDYREEGTFASTAIQPTIDSESNYDPASGISVNPAEMAMTMPLAGIDFNWTPTKKINVGFGYSVTGGTPVLEQQFNPLQVDPNTSDTNVGPDSTGVSTVVQRFFPIMINRFEIKPQFFLSPRMTLGLYFAYMLSTPLELDKATINDEYSVRPWTGDEPSNYEQDLRDKYYNISPYILGGGHDIRDLAFNGFMYGISFNFYF